MNHRMTLKKLNAALRKEFKAMVKEMVNAKLGKTKKAELGKVRARVDAAIADADIPYKGTASEKRYLKSKTGLKTEELEGSPKVATIRASAAWKAKRTKYRLQIRSQTAKTILSGETYTSELESNLAEFRTYLAEHLPSLI